tara:strand:+ start:33778 stop:34884 length:1107 start_codon:yes stop_codon:yes gene_type:complete
MKKIKLNKTEENIALVQALAGKDKAKAYQAQLALAAFVGPLISEFSEKARTLSNLFTTLTFDADDAPSVPVDLYYDITDEQEIMVWSQTTAGGLATNFLQPVESEMKFHTNTLQSAWSFDNKHVRRNRMDVLGKSLTKIMQEIMIKQDRYSATLILNTLGDNHNGTSTSHVIDSVATGKMLPADLNALTTRAKRIRKSWNGGTPVGAEVGPTDLILSPERMADIRSMAFEPVNTKGANATTGTAASGTVDAPDSVREELWGGAGVASFWGLGLLELLELGPNEAYCNLYDTFAGGTFNAGDDLVVAVNQRSESLLRAVNTDAETYAEFTISPDDQFTGRAKKTGFVGEVEEGRMVIDARDILGIRIQA